jgi:thioredoxin-related protein
LLLYRSLLLVVTLSALLALPAAAAELLMYRRAGCPWCAAWDRDIGPIYGKTDIGRRAPIRFVDLDHKNAQEIVLASPVRYTPTFVLVEGGKELGRIEGYPGEDFFWGFMKRLVELLPVRHEVREQPRTLADPGEMVEQNL